MLTRKQKQAKRKAIYHSREVGATPPKTTKARETYTDKVGQGIIKQRPNMAQTTVKGALQSNGDHALFLTNQVSGIPTVKGRQIIAKHKVRVHTLDGIPVLTTVEQPAAKPVIRAIITPTDYVTIGKVSQNSINYYCAKQDIIEAKQGQ